MAIQASADYVSTTTNGYTVRTTPTTAILASSSNSMASYNISTNTDTIENSKIVMGIDIKVAYSNVGANLQRVLLVLFSSSLHTNLKEGING